MTQFKSFKLVVNNNTYNVTTKQVGNRVTATVNNSLIIITLGKDNTVYSDIRAELPIEDYKQVVDGIIAKLTK